jgi:uncharacterized protein
MKLIAIEEHFLTPDIDEAWAMASVKDASTILNRGVVGERLGDFGHHRLTLMDETGVDVQVLALTTPGLHNLGDESVALAKKTNDLIATTTAIHPDRFQGLAVLPTPVPKEAPRELERAVLELGLKGAMLYGRTREKHLDRQHFWAIFEVAEALNVPLFIHPQMPQQAVREASYGGFGDPVNLALSSFALGWHYEAGLQFVRMVLAGVFDRFPRLQVILGHWGEVVLFYSERLAMLDRVANLQRPFIDYARRNMYVTASGMFSDTYLHRAVDIVGIDRILFSTDYPYQYRPGGDARRFLEAVSLGDEAKRKFAHANWERLTSRQATSLGSNL